MPSEPLQKNDGFLAQLIYFGASLSGADIKVCRKEYQDLELFFLEATLNMSWNVRVTNAIISWVHRYGVLLSPSKLRRLLKTTPHDSAVMGALIFMIKESDPRASRWRILNSFLKKNKQSALLFPHLPPPVSNENPHFKKYGIIAHALPPNPDKYLLPQQTVLQNCVEIRNRAQMVNTVAADVFSAIEKDLTLQSSYEVANRVHHHRAQVHAVITLGQRFGTLEFPKKEAA
jgi:hypothetical protein